MNVVATFSGAKYHDTTARIVADSPRFGADRVMVYDDFWLLKHRPEFCDRTSWFFRRANGGEGRPRGVCWFCFKPLVVLDAFRRLSPGDMLLWLDADTYPVAPLAPLFDRCRADGGKMLFNVLGCKNRWYTKRDAFTLMGLDGPDGPPEAYLETFQCVARFMLFERGGAFPAEAFLGEWLGFTANPLVNTFEPSILGRPDDPGFIQNRCEQSVLTNLAVKYGCRLYREACGFGNGGKEDWGVYPQTFEQVGSHSYRPGYAGDESEGSAFRNVDD